MNEELEKRIFKQTIIRIITQFPAFIWSILTMPIKPLTQEEKEEDRAYQEFKRKRGEWL